MTIRKSGRLNSLLRKLSEEGPVDPYAIAFLMTERAFRGVLFRLMEIAYSAFWLVVLRRDPNVTLGHCQVSFAYWREEYGKRNFSLLVATMTERGSYHICRKFLNNNRKESLKDLLICYTGRPTTLYVQLFLVNLRAVRDCASQIGIPLTPGFPTEVIVPSAKV